MTPPDAFSASPSCAPSPPATGKAPQVQVVEAVAKPVTVHACYLSPDDVDAALKKWADEELKQAATRAYDVAKFLLGVSSASLTALVAVGGYFKNLGIAPSFLCLAPSAAFLLGSMVYAIISAIPTARPITNVDLYAAHEMQVTEARAQPRKWLIFWLPGVILALLAFGLTK
jgi:hypothetical protein